MQGSSRSYATNFKCGVENFPAHSANDFSRRSKGRSDGVSAMGRLRRTIEKEGTNSRLPGEIFDCPLCVNRWTSPRQATTIEIRGTGFYQLTPVRMERNERASIGDGVDTTVSPPLWKSGFTTSMPTTTTALCCLDANSCAVLLCVVKAIFVFVGTAWSAKSCRA